MGWTDQEAVPVGVDHPRPLLCALGSCSPWESGWRKDLLQTVCAMAMELQSQKRASCLTKPLPSLYGKELMPSAPSLTIFPPCKKWNQENKNKTLMSLPEVQAIYIVHYLCLSKWFPGQFLGVLEAKYSSAFPATLPMFQSPVGPLIAVKGSRIWHSGIKVIFGYLRSW